MSWVEIKGIWTMNPADVWKPVGSFFWNDPFGVTIHITCSSDLVEKRALYDIQWQLVCPREDIFELVWWGSMSGVIDSRPTIDFLFKDQPFEYTNFGHWITWGKYSDPMGSVGAAQFPGVFAVRGFIQVKGTDLFDMTKPYGYHYQLREK